MKGVPMPRFVKASVEVFSKEEIELLLKACDQCREAQTTDRCTFSMPRPTAKRDRAIILTLLDPSLRASELSTLKVGDLDMKTGRLEVKHGAEGGAKGGKAIPG
jgi:integrase/recombinase XerD